MLNRHRLPTPPAPRELTKDELAGRVAELEAQNAELQARVRELEQSIVKAEIEQLQASDVPPADDTKPSVPDPLAATEVSDAARPEAVTIADTPAAKAEGDPPAKGGRKPK